MYDKTGSRKKVVTVKPSRWQKIQKISGDSLKAAKAFYAESFFLWVFGFTTISVIVVGIFVWLITISHLLRH